MKGLIIALMLVPSAQAQTQLVPLNFYQACFGGMDDYHNSARIDNCDFQYLVNILTDRGFLEKRPGSVRVFDSVLSGYPIKNFKEFITPANRKYLLIHASQTVYSTDLLTISSITTTNVNAVMDSVSAFDKHFIVNGYDTPVYYDGTTTTSIPEMPVCKFVEFANERLLCANVAGAASTLYESGYADYTNWTIPIVESADAPTAFSFDAQDGQPLTGLFQSPFGTLAFKRSKMFIIRGVDGDDFEKKRLSDKVGCIDDRSIQLVDGCVQWLGVEGVYRWCGGATTPELVSRDIDTTIKAIRNITSNADTISLTTQADFEKGNRSVNGSQYGFSTVSVPNSIVPSSWTSITTDFTNTSFTNLSTMSVPGSIALPSLTPVTGYLDEHLQTVTTGGLSVTKHSPYGWTFYNSSPYEPTQYVGRLSTATILTSTSTYNARSTTTWAISTSFAEYAAGYAAILELFFVTDSTSITNTNGYSIKISYQDGTNQGRVYLYKYTTGSATQLGTGVFTVSRTYPNNTFKVIQDTSGVFRVWWEKVWSPTSTLLFTTTSDTAYVISTGTLITEKHWTGLGASTFYITSYSYEVLGITPTGTLTSSIFDTGYDQPIGGPFIVQSTVPTNTTILYSIAQATSTTGPFTTFSITENERIPCTQRYWVYSSTLSTTNLAQSPTISSIQLNASSTGTWDSEVINVGTLLTSWGQFNAITATNDHLLFYTRASMTPYSVDSATPSWTVQGNGYNIACDTGTYLQARVTSTIGSSTDTAQVLSLTFNWYEGEASQVASLFWDGRYYLSVSTGTEGTINNTVLVQQRNKKWTLFNGVNWSTLGIYDNAPYAGDGLTTSKIWRIIEEESYFDDNTKAINAEAITKDFQFDGQNNNKVFRKLYVESNPSVASTLSLGYSVDKSTTYYTTTQAIGLTPFNDEIKRFFPGFAKGQYLRLKFSNNTIYEPLMLNGYTLIGDIENLYRK